MTAGSTSAWPAATVRIAPRVLAPGVLQQEPARAGAQRREHVLVEVERRQDQRRAAASVARPAIWRVASRPSSPACGCPSARRRAQLARRASTASRAVGGLADDLDVRLGLEDHPEARRGPAPGRRRRATRMRHGVARSSGSRARTLESAAGAAPASRSPPQQRDPLAHPDQPVPRPGAASPARGRRRRDLEPSASRVVADPHLGRGAAGVLERVGQRLLHDPVRRQVDAGRQRAGARRRVRPRPASPAYRTASTNAPSRPGPAAARARLAPPPRSAREQPPSRSSVRLSRPTASTLQRAGRRRAIVAAASRPAPARP